MSDKLTSKQKIDLLLGIQDDLSIDSFLDNLTLQTDEISSAFDGIDCRIKEKMQGIDNTISEIQDGKTNSVLALNSMNMSMKEVEELIDLSKKLFKHVYENIISSDLLDSELIEAAAKMLESVHINIGEFLQMYRDRQRFIEKIKIMVFLQEQKKELMLLKHKLDMEKLSMKAEPEAVDAELMPYNMADISRVINKNEDEE